MTFLLHKRRKSICATATKRSPHKSKPAIPLIFEGEKGFAPGGNGAGRSFDAILAGVGRELSTLAVPVVNLATAVCVPIAGALATRYSLRLIMLAGTILSVAGFALLALTASYPLYLVAFGLLLGPGMAVGVILPATTGRRYGRSITHQATPAARAAWCSACGQDAPHQPVRADPNGPEQTLALTSLELVLVTVAEPAKQQRGVCHAIVGP